MAYLIISIDFELRWGVLDKVYDDINTYRENLLSVHENIPWILELFKEKNIHATWATVGALGCDNWEEFDKIKPIKVPSYKNQKLIYDNNFNKKIDPKGDLYFAPNLVKKIIETPGQELGMHTFGHIYATEPNVTYEEFLEDLYTCKSFFQKKYSYSPISLVYPRNQVIYEKDLLKDEIILCYRGNEEVEYFSAKNQRNKKFFNRIKILFDSLNPFSTHKYVLNYNEKSNIKSSSMLRIYYPYWLRKIHLGKLKYNISNLKDDEIFHIWFHPHNIGPYLNRKRDFENFICFIEKQVLKGKLKSVNMKELYYLYEGKK